MEYPARPDRKPGPGGHWARVGVEVLTVWGSLRPVSATGAALRVVEAALVAALGESSERRAERRDEVQARLARGLSGG